MSKRSIKHLVRGHYKDISVSERSIKLLARCHYQDIIVSGGQLSPCLLLAGIWSQLGFHIDWCVINRAPRHAGMMALH